MANTRDECAGCGKKCEGMKKCGRCMEVEYCSKECQVKDWRMHKLACCPDSMGEDIDRDLAEFTAKCRTQYSEIPSSKELGEKELKRLVSSNPWPSKKKTDHFLKSYEMGELGEGFFAPGDGPRYYNYTLGKELYNAGGISDIVKRWVAMRRVGWKIKAHGESVAGKENRLGIVRCMWVHSITLAAITRHGVAPIPPSNIFFTVLAVRLDWAWDGIYPTATGIQGPNKIM